MRFSTVGKKASISQSMRFDFIRVIGKLVRFSLAHSVHTIHIINNNISFMFSVKTEIISRIIMFIKLA